MSDHRSVPISLVMPNGTRNAVLVEPSSTMARVLSDVAKDFGFFPLHARSVVEGIGLVVRKRPGFVVVPHLSGELPGAALARAIRSCPTYAAIPVAMVSSADPQSIDRRRLEIDHVVPRGPEMSAELESWLASLGLRSNATDAPANDRPPLSGRILLAEDTALMQQLISRVLHAAGASVTIVENGAEAVAQASRSAFDLILMDVEMPVMTGPEALQTMRRLGIAAPIVALTAHGDAYADEAEAEGFDGLLDKRLRPAELVIACAPWIQARRAA